MFGWTQRYIFTTKPALLPKCLESCWWKNDGFDQKKVSFFSFFLCLILVYGCSLGARLLESPYWNSPAYMIDSEHLLATHDAYHWIAGSEGFEFGAGHPFSELVRIMSKIIPMSIANIGFWLPPFVASLVSVTVFIWAWGLGFPFAGVCAGILTSLSPSYFARTMLGFYDTDIVVLIFANIVGLIPALWIHPWIASPVDLFVSKITRRYWKYNDTRKDILNNNSPYFFWKKFLGEPIVLSINIKEVRSTILSSSWIFMLVLSGLFGNWMQEWHSFFPYLIRYSAILLPILTFVFGPIHGRRFFFQGGVAYALPLLIGVKGGIIALLYLFLLKININRVNNIDSDSFYDGKIKKTTRIQSIILPLKKIINNDLCLIALWCITIFFCIDSQTFELMRSSFISYVERSGDIASNSTLNDPIIYPSVTSSIIEAQTIQINELFSYMYPKEIIIYLALIAFCIRIIFTPVLLWFLPMLLLSFLSVKMGGRMVMFGPSVLMLSLCIEATIVLRFTVKYCLHFIKKFSGTTPFTVYFIDKNIVKLVCCLVFSVTLTVPLITLIPDYTQGPIISKEQAEGLTFIKNNTPKDSIVWNWWDWGYATHHFSHRHTIADGARHGGASLYLPAAVYTTTDPRFARQLIKYTSLKNNIPGKVFEGLTAYQAQKKLIELGNKNSPLIDAPGKQYVVVSFELLRVGLWVTRYGSWDFIKKKGTGGLVSNLNLNLEVDIKSGLIKPSAQQGVYASSISFFSDKGLKKYYYPQQDGNNFIFNLQNQTSFLPVNHYLLERFWEWQKGYFYYTAQTSDKLVLDPVMFNSLMVQLLIKDVNDKKFSPYFKCVFDNTFTRVYEVL